MSNPSLASYQDFPQVVSPFVKEDRSIEETWRRLLVALWIRSGAKIGSTLNAGVIQQTSTAEGAPLGVYDPNTGALLGTIALANQPGLPPEPQTLGASPFTFTSIEDGFMVASSGELEIDRGAGFQQVSLVGGQVVLCKDDVLRVSWTVSSPSVVWYPSGAAGG